VGTSVLVLYRHDWALHCLSLWACVKVDDCCNSSSTGTLTHIKSLKNVC
jgi:hypothetical protein